MKLSKIGADVTIDEEIPGAEMEALVSRAIHVFNHHPEAGPLFAARQEFDTIGLRYAANGNAPDGEVLEDGVERLAMILEREFGSPGEATAP